MVPLAVLGVEAIPWFKQTQKVFICSLVQHNALFPKHCEQGAPGNVRALRLAAHSKSQCLTRCDHIPALTDCVAIFEHDGQSLSDAQLHRLGVICRKFGPGPDDQFIEIGAAIQITLSKKNRPDGRLREKHLRRGAPAIECLQFCVDP